MCLTIIKKRQKTLWMVFVMVFVLLNWNSTLLAQYVQDDGWREFGKKYWPTEPVRGGIYKYAHTKYVGLMNPNHWPVNDFDTLTYIYERMIFRDGQARSSMPFLVKSWRIIDPLTAETVLEEGVKFHDGSDFDAASVKYQMDWINDKKNGCWTRSYLTLLKSVEVIDKYTVKWHFKKPWAVFAPNVMSGIPGRPISAKALKNDVMLKELDSLMAKFRTAKKKKERAEKKVAKAGDGKKAAKAKKKLKKEIKNLKKIVNKVDLLKEKTAGTQKTDLKPVGTGSFMIDHGRPGNYLKLKRNPKWWYAEKMERPNMPYFDGIQVMVIPDPAIQLANLRARKIQAMVIDKSLYQIVKNDPNLVLHINPTNHLSGLRFNLAKGPAKDIRVRKAISHAIDRKGIITGTQFGLARIAACMFPKEHWCHNPELEPVSYNPELAQVQKLPEGEKLKHDE